MPFECLDGDIYNIYVWLSALLETQLQLLAQSGDFYFHGHLVLFTSVITLQRPLILVALSMAVMLHTLFGLKKMTVVIDRDL